MDIDGSGVFTKQKFRKIYNAKHKKYLIKMILGSKNDYIIYTRIRREYPGRKQRATGYVYLKVSPYCDAEGSSQL